MLRNCPWIIGPPSAPFLDEALRNPTNKEKDPLVATVLSLVPNKALSGTGGLLHICPVKCESRRGVYGFGFSTGHIDNLSQRRKVRAMTQRLLRVNLLLHLRPGYKVRKGSLLPGEH